MPKNRIYLSPPDIGLQEREFVKEAFDTNWIAPLGPHVDAFEDELSDYVGDVSCTVLSSGTAAMHLALRILGIEQNDEVICQSFTFCGSVNPIVYEKARPVFVDSEKDTWNMDPGLLEDCVKDRIKSGKKPKGIIYVHLYGMPAKVDEILAIGKKYDIPVIEDAAEALGSKYKGKQAGGLGLMSILSFNGNKIITSGGGGALLSENLKFTERAKFLSTQARDNAPHYQHSEIGYNYRMSNVAAAIGRGQLMDLNEKIERRREIYSTYKKAFGNIDGISFIKEPESTYSNRWLTTLLVDQKKTHGVSREEIRLSLEKENIESRPFWKPMHSQPVFKDALFFGNGVSEVLFRDGLCLPSGSGMTDLELDNVISTLRKCLTN